jgi:hypothetical protein
LRKPKTSYVSQAGLVITNAYTGGEKVKVEAEDEGYLMAVLIRARITLTEW